MKIEVVRDEAAFEAMRVEWDALLQASAEDTPFLRHHWISSWWTAYGQGDSLALVTCRDEDGRLLGVLPGYLERSCLGSSAFRLLADDHVGSHGMGPFAAAGTENAVMAALADHLTGSASPADVLDLRVMSQQGAFYDQMRRARRGWVVRVRRNRYGCPVVMLPDSWDRYLAENVTRRVRASIRRSLRRTRDAGLQVEFASDPRRLPAQLDDLLRLWRERMETVAGPHFTVEEAYKDFVFDVAPTLLEEGRLLLALMLAEGTAVSAEYRVAHGGTAYALFGGFDERYAPLAVHKALSAHVLQRAIDMGCGRFDFGLGTQAYKSDWGVTEVLGFCDIRAYAISPGPLLRLVKDELRAWAVGAVDALPPSLGRRVTRLVKRVRASVRRARR